jgi:hypothetical protein
MPLFDLDRTALESYLPAEIVFDKLIARPRHLRGT